MDFNNDQVVIHLAMLRIGDKLLELEEHLSYEQQLVAELKQLMVDWAVVFPQSGEAAPLTEDIKQ